MSYSLVRSEKARMLMVVVLSVQFKKTLTSQTPQAGVDLAPSYYWYGLPSRFKNAYFKK